MSALYHFSEDGSIDRFEPHVPTSNPTQAAAVWAIDDEHAPLYWFPRACPRVTAWPRTDDERVAFSSVLATSARRLHAIEIEWLQRMQTTQLYRYEFAVDDFTPWIEASGQWVSDHSVEPVDVIVMDNLVELHRGARIELRLVPNLWPLVDIVTDDRWDFSLVRLMNAAPAASKTTCGGNG